MGERGGGQASVDEEVAATDTDTQDKSQNTNKAPNCKRKNMLESIKASHLSDMSICLKASTRPAAVRARQALRS